MLRTDDMDPFSTGSPWWRSPSHTTVNLMRGPAAISRILLVALISVLVAGCASFTAGVEEPDLAAQAKATSTALHVGETTRAQARALLGTPRFADTGWGIELYAQNESDHSTEWVVVLLVPVPGLMQTRHYRLFPLLAYDPSGTVAAFDVGQYAEHPDTYPPVKVPETANAQVLGFDLEVEPCPQPSCVSLLAPVEESVTALRSPPAPGTCAVNIAMPGDALRVWLDDELLLENRTEATYPGAPVAQPKDRRKIAKDRWFARITLLPGAHTLRTTSTAPSLYLGGSFHLTLDCRSGAYMVIRTQHQILPRENWFSRLTLEGEFAVSDSPDEIPDDARLVLFHNGQSMVAPP
jgi:hypothetical protein